MNDSVPTFIYQMGVLILIGALYVPFGLAAYCWHLWAHCKNRWVRRVSCVLFWLLILWVLGWFLQWGYVTHCWYSWESQHKFKMF